jgi:hypothetical protein
MPFDIQVKNNSISLIDSKVEIEKYLNIFFDLYLHRILTKRMLVKDLRFGDDEKRRKIIYNAHIYATTKWNKSLKRLQIQGSIIRGFTINNNLLLVKAELVMSDGEYLYITYRTQLFN